MQTTTSSTAMMELPSMAAVNSLFDAMVRKFNVRFPQKPPTTELDLEKHFVATMQQLEDPGSTEISQPAISSLCDMINQTWISLHQDVRTSLKQRLLGCMKGRFPPANPRNIGYREWRRLQDQFGSFFTRKPPQQTSLNTTQLELLLTVAISILFRDLEDGDDWPELFEAVFAAYPSEVSEITLSALTNHIIVNSAHNISTATWGTLAPRLPQLIEQGLFASNVRLFSVVFCGIPPVALDAATWQKVPYLLFGTLKETTGLPSQLGCHRVFLKHSDELFNAYIHATAMAWQHEGMRTVIDYQLLWKDCLARDKQRAAAALRVHGPSLLDALRNSRFSNFIFRPADILEFTCMVAQYIPTEAVESVVQQCLSELERVNDEEDLIGEDCIGSTAVLAGIFKMAATSISFSRLLENDLLESVYAKQAVRLIAVSEEAAAFGNNGDQPQNDVAKMHAYRRATHLYVTSLLCCHLLCMQWRQQGVFDWDKFAFLRQHAPRRVKVFKQVGAVLNALSAAHRQVSLLANMDLDLQRFAEMAVDGVSAAARRGNSWPWGMEVVLKRLPEDQLAPLIEATVKSLVSVRVPCTRRYGRPQHGGYQDEVLAGKEEWADQEVNVNKAIYTTDETTYLADLEIKSLASYVYNICKLAPRTISKQTAMLLHAELCELFGLLHPNLAYASMKDISKVVGILNCWPVPHIDACSHWTPSSHAHLYPDVQKRAMALFLSAKRHALKGSDCAFGQLPRPALWNIAEFAFDISSLHDMEGLGRLYASDRRVMKLLRRLQPIDKLLKRSRQAAKAMAALQKLPNWQWQ
eukprot:GILK01015434.1.p1 GENE.GILK01015434.1~~GILK01015434.1.p1  ORF type:complete len:808 (-),score=95.17 GILK01015434.1:258-2681(-)